MGEPAQQWLSVDEAKRLFSSETWNHYVREDRFYALTKLYNISIRVKLFLSPLGIYSGYSPNERPCKNTWTFRKKLGILRLEIQL